MLSASNVESIHAVEPVATDLHSERPLADSDVKTVGIMPGVTKLDASIPSSSEGVNLEGTIYLPGKSVDARRNSEHPFILDGPPKLAILAHPWGRLGGSKDDPVLTRYITPALLEAGYLVVTYNARGVGQSEGWSSWLGGNEGEDAAAVVTWFLQRMGIQEGIKVSLICCGYSYGSLAAVLSLPLVEARHPSLHISCLLVSPPISLISGMSYLPFAAAKLFNAALKSQGHVFTVTGDRDQFTAVERSRAWATQYDIGYKEFSGADHFWRGGSGRQMADAIRDWLVESA